MLCKPKFLHNYSFIFTINNVTRARSRTAVHNFQTQNPVMYFHNSSLSSQSQGGGAGASEKKLMRRRNTLIKKMDPSEYDNTAILKHKLPVLDRRGEQTSVFRHLRLKAEDDKPGHRTDMLAFLNADIDLRPSAIKRVLASLDAQTDIENQKYKPERVRVLGSDLSAAHFILYRKGRVKFVGRDWFSNYRKDADPEDNDDDLPAMRTDLCALPTNYDPNYQLEAIDASNVVIRYEGIQNFENLHYLTWLSFRNCRLIDDWCLDRIYHLFSETLEYLDLSNCKKVTASGLEGAWRLKNLKTLVVEDMGQVKNLELVCANLEEYNKELTCIGIDYAKKLEEIKQEKSEIEQNILLDEAAKEKITIDVVPVSVKPAISSGKQENQASS